MTVLKYTQTRIVAYWYKERDERDGETERPSERKALMCEHFGPCGTLFHVYKLIESFTKSPSAFFMLQNRVSRKHDKHGIQGIWSTIVRGATVLELWSQMITDEVTLLLWTVQTSSQLKRVDCAGWSWWSRCWLCGVGSHLLVGKSVQHRWHIIWKTFLKQKTEELIVSFVKSMSNLIH